jgi:cupin fold WbuC family metalloprotein
MKIVDKQLLEKMLLEAKNSSRHRTMQCFHEHPGDSLQRMINLIERGSYVRPHRHVNPSKREVLIILHGQLACLEFDDSGNIIKKYVLDSNNGNFVVEISDKCFHTIIALSDFAAVFEVKDGPYIQSADKDFAQWAPDEDSTEGYKYLENLISKI